MVKQFWSFAPFLSSYKALLEKLNLPKVREEYLNDYIRRIKRAKIWS